MSSQDHVVVGGFARTPFGSFQGSLSQMSAPQLGAHAIRGALERAGIEPHQVSEVILGNVLSAGVGQAPARQAMRAAGLPDSTHALTINKVCGSGMKAMMLGMQSLRLGDSEVVVAGGMESMSQAPYLVQSAARGGFKMGNQPLIDSMIHDGLWDPYSNQHMGTCGDLCAREKGFSREDQDGFATESFRRAQAAQKEGHFKEEISPIEIQGRKGEKTLVDLDEGPSKVKFDKIPQLRAVFSKEGTVTAANASTLNDGAVAGVLVLESKAKALGVKPLARIVSYGTHSQTPEWFTTAPTGAMQKAMDRAGWKVEDVDLFEVNEAFAVVSLSAQRDLKIPSEKLNVWGGAISLGHPIGASGARISYTLVTQMRALGKKRGVAGICIGGGEATALCIELI